MTTMIAIAAALLFAHSQSANPPANGPNVIFGASMAPPTA
jgi:hypothetical protein